jgi:hypothetical protein
VKRESAVTYLEGPKRSFPARGMIQW